nr:methyltransferase [Ancylobacter tetraedralis]
MGSPWHAGAWAQILSSVDVPTSAFEKVFSEDVFSYLEKFPDERDVFDRAMAFTSSAHAEAIALAIRVDTKATLVDVAGGTGLLLRELLERNPELEGVLFERPEVVEKATSYLSSAGMGERCRVVSGDFFKSVPSGGDIYMLKYIIHDWSDEDAGIILRNCRTAMKDDGKLILLEVVQPDRNPSFSEVWSDIEMMVVLPGGRERTRAEFGDLLATSGFELVDVRRTRSELSVIEALPR